MSPVDAHSGSQFIHEQSGIDQEMADDKRRRNTEASGKSLAGDLMPLLMPISARFRMKKKEKIQQMEETMSSLQKRAEDLEREAGDLRRENGWLKEMVIMKGRRGGLSTPAQSGRPVDMKDSSTGPIQDEEGDSE